MHVQDGVSTAATGRPVTVFRVLYVCSANLCRSVTAEALTRQALLRSGRPDDVRWDIRSAGLDVHHGARVPSAIREAMERLEIPTDREPRRVDADHVAAADLILTAERDHRSRLVRQFHEANLKTYTIRQFARFCAAGRELEDPGFVAAGDEVMRLANAGRMRVQPVPGEQDDIADPTRIATSEAMIDCARTIRAAVRRITGA